MNIILTQCFPSKVGGIEYLMGNLSLNLARSKKVVVLADQDNFLKDSLFDKKNKKKLVVRRFSGIKFFRKRNKIKELKLLIKKHKVNSVISDSWKSLELCIDFLSEKKIKTICLAHGNELLHKSIFKKKRVEKVLNKVSKIVSNSKYTANILNKLIKNKNKIKVIYPGAEDLRKIKEEKFLNITGKPILLTLGRLEKRKGHLYVLKALKLLIKKHPKIRYIIAGEGKEQSNLKEFVIKNKLQKNVIFTGLVDERKKKYLFKKSDLMVMPTLNETMNQSIEGFGIVYLEASFFQIPSIASNVGGTPEAVINKKTGIIIDSHDNLCKNIDDLISNKNKLSQFGKNARIRAINKFKWSKIIKDYLKLI